MAVGTESRVYGNARRRYVLQAMTVDAESSMEAKSGFHDLTDYKWTERFGCEILANPLEENR